MELDWVLQDILKRQESQFIDAVNRWNGLQGCVHPNFAGSTKASSCIIENGQSLKMSWQLCQALPATVFTSERKAHQLPCDPCHSCPWDELSHRTTISCAHSQLYGTCGILQQSFPVHNLEDFVICWACLNVHALQIFKCFCHTHRVPQSSPSLNFS